MAVDSQRDTRQNSFSPNSRLALVLIIVASAIIHVATLVLGKTSAANWRWEHIPVHSVVEVAGSIIALYVAALLISLERKQKGTSYNYIISAALVGMGITDGAHALLHPGHTFVALHSMATFLGGCLFLLVFLPSSLSRRLSKKWPILVAIIAVLISFIAIKFQTHLPAMFDEDGFTPSAISLNLVGGVFLLAASVRLLLTYRRTRKVDDLLFVLHTSMFGGAAIMFQQSSLWDLPWWGWHILRFFAYGVALWFAFIDDVRDQAVTYVERDYFENEAEALREALRNLELAKNQLVKQEALAGLGTMLSGVAHELNSPLGVCTTAASICEEELQLLVQRRQDETLTAEQLDGSVNKLSEANQMIRRNLLRCTELNNQFKQLSSDSVHEDLREFDLVAYINETIDSLRYGYHAKGFNFTLSGASSLHVVHMPGLFAQILTNLVQNSIAHAYPDTSQGEISILIEQDGDQLHLVYADDGRGMPEDVAEHIFEPFFTTAREQGGTGLGMHLVHKLVADSGGVVSCQSAEGKGTRFDIILPLVPPSRTQDKAETTRTQ